MALTRQERILLHKKAQTPLTGAGAPSKLDGKDGDVAYRRLSGVGVVHYIKREGEWQALSSTDKMPAERATIRVAGGTGASITDHGGMSGLGDDDHTQYLLVDGTRAVTGDLSLSGGDGALTFTVAGENSIKIPDNQASALIIEEANNAYLTFNTANSGGEKITLGKKLEAGSVEIEGTAFDINGGAIDGTAIGASSHSTIKGTTIDATTDFTIGDTIITDGVITDSTGLSVAANLTVTGNVLPNADDTYDIGSATAAWQDLFLEGDMTMTDAGTISTSAGALTITSAAAATWGTSAGSLSLHGTTGILLREGSATILQIDNSRNITTTNTAQVDFDCSGSFSINSSGGVLNIGNDDIDQNINIGTQGERTISVGTGSFADDINIGNATGATALDLDAGTGGVTIDSTGTVSIDGADDMNFTITSSTGGEDLTIEQIGANNSSIFIKAAGTGADAIFIDATAGSMSIGSSLVDQKILTLGNTSSTYLKLSPHDTTGSEKILLHNAAGTDDESIKIHSVAGGITMLSGSTMFLDADNLSIGDAGDVPVEISATTFDLDATSWIRIDGTAVSIDGTDDSNLTVTGSNKDLTLSVAGGSTQTLTISSAGTGTNAIDINATAGGVDVDASGAIALDAGAASNLTTSAGALTITSAAAATWSTAAGNLTVDSAAGVLVLDGHTGITLDASNSGNIEINVTAADDILIGNDAVAQDILLGNAAATQVDLTAILVDINGGSSGVTIDGAAASNFTTSAGAITIDAEASTVTVDGHTGVTVQSTNSGNITLDSVADIVLSAAGGNVTMDDGTTTVFDFNTNDPELKIMDDAQVANYASIAVGSNGATTLATVDADAAAANFTLDVDGDIIFDADGGDIAFEDGGSRALKIDMDATAGDAIFADAGNTEIFRIDGSEDSLRIKNHAQALTNPYSLYVLPTGGCHYTSGAADYQQNVSVVCIHDLEPGTNVDNNSWYS